MAEQQRTGHPIVFGLIALVGVTVVVGGILAGGALAATRVLGIDDSSTATDTNSKFETLSIPPLTASDLGQEDNYYSLPPEDPTSSATATSKYPTSSDPATPAGGITLVSAETAVGPMEHLDLSGTYPAGAGAILEVEQYTSGTWDTFPVTIPVHDDGTFSTYIQTGQTGLNKFRVVDTDGGEKSNAVKVTIG